MIWGQVVNFSVKEQQTLPQHPRGYYFFMSRNVCVQAKRGLKHKDTKARRHKGIIVTSKAVVFHNRCTREEIVVFLQAVLTVLPVAENVSTYCELRKC